MLISVCTLKHNGIQCIVSPMMNNVIFISKCLWVLKVKGLIFSLSLICVNAANAVKCFLFKKFNITEYFASEVMTQISWSFFFTRRGDGNRQWGEAGVYNENTTASIMLIYVYLCMICNQLQCVLSNPNQLWYCHANQLPSVGHGCSCLGYVSDRLSVGT